MERVGSMMHTQGLSNNPYPEPNQSNSLYVINTRGKLGKVKGQENWLQRDERSDTYLAHVCRLSQSLESLERTDKKPELSANIVAVEVMNATVLVETCGFFVCSF